MGAKWLIRNTGAVSTGQDGVGSGGILTASCGDIRVFGFYPMGKIHFHLGSQR